MLKTAEKFKEVVYKFCKRMLDEEVFPSIRYTKERGKEKCCPIIGTYIARIGYQEQQRGWWWK